MKGLPVTIRLLDPPLHEFLPHTDAEIEEVARAMIGVSAASWPIAATPSLHEFNPMLGHPRLPARDRLSRDRRDAGTRDLRGGGRSREATGKCRRARGDDAARSRPRPSSMLVEGADRSRWRQDVMRETGAKLAYQVGTMIELPRAALLAGEIAKSAEFFSFGTNDLTQTTYGISRDDAGKLPPRLRREGHSGDRSVHLARSRRRRRTGEDRRGTRPQDPARPEGRHLRRAWRRSGFASRSATRSG